MSKTSPSKREYQRLEDSSLYRLNSPDYAARILQYPWDDLQTLAARDDNYVHFELQERGRDKVREIEWPKAALDRVQRRILALLCRIRSPGYLHSSVRGRSYITNASAHVGRHPAFTLDIRDFYPSVSRQQVFNCFHGTFEQAADMAGLLAALCSTHNHLPTGGAASQRLGFFAHKPLFDRIAAWCRSNGLVFTLYVDDLTVSGPGAMKSALRTVESMITDAGLKYHKVKMYGPTDAKSITGVVVRENGLLVHNKHQRRIYDQLIDLKSAEYGDENLDNISRSLLGRLNSAAQVEPRFEGWLASTREIVREAMAVAAKARSGISEGENSVAA